VHIPLMAAEHTDDGIVDIAIIGGGINGAGIAREASGRGWSVVLFEQADLASGTSNWSSKLIHGGLRYLEHYEFRLVREALIEREVLLKIAPHIIEPLRFVLPHHAGLRPAWLLRLGLFLYDNLGGRKILPGTATLDLSTHATGKPLKPMFAKGFEYSDCAVQDCRLVVLNAMDARRRGAVIRTRTPVVSAERAGDHWLVRWKGPAGEGETRARALVNAAGPWVERVLSGIVRSNVPSKVRMVKGSHIVVKKLFDHDRAYIFQNADGRIIFAIPYEGDFTLVGTTDEDYHGDPADVAISQAETDYLLAAVSEYFREPVTRDSIVWTYSGVRPLYDDGASKAQEATRDYVLKLDAPDGQPALLNIFGGKITTYRRLAESALAEIAPHLPPAAGGAPAGWTGSEPLPGGDFPHDGRAALAEKLVAKAPFLARATAARFARTYGKAAFQIIDGRKTAAEMGRTFGEDLTEAEVSYLVAEEWATCADDIIWRRSRLGLRLSGNEVATLDDWIKDKRRAG
jgi:glycerol-3-phosphate dehydrogenase